MFGVSLSELLVIAVIALIVVGPQKLPGMLRNLGQWIARLRRLTTEVRAQTGIDEVLREEGIDGVRELRSLLRGELTASRGRSRRDGYEDTVEVDEAQEFPPEGADAGGALPDDLLDAGAEDEVADVAGALATNGAGEHDAVSGEITSAAGALTEAATETSAKDAKGSAAPTRPLPPRPNRETKS